MTSIAWHTTSSGGRVDRCEDRASPAVNIVKNLHGILQNCADIFVHSCTEVGLSSHPEWGTVPLVLQLPDAE